MIAHKPGMIVKTVRRAKEDSTESAIGAAEQEEGEDSGVSDHDSK